MFYFLCGSDMNKVRGKAREIILSLQKKKPNAEFFRLTSENFSAATFDELIGAQGLFERRFIVFTDQVLSVPEIKNFIMGKLTALADSQNIFIFLEGEADKGTISEIKLAGAKIQTFDEEISPNQKIFNVFSLTDALGRRRRDELWVLYQKALRFGSSPEELSGLLFWQVKNMILARDVLTPGDSGLTPFVFNKSKKFSGNFSAQELDNLAHNLVTIYHDAHRGCLDFEIGLERLILKV